VTSSTARYLVIPFLSLILGTATRADSPGSSSASGPEDSSVHGSVRGSEVGESAPDEQGRPRDDPDSRRDEAASSGVSQVVEEAGDAYSHQFGSSWVIPVTTPTTPVTLPQTASSGSGQGTVTPATSAPAPSAVGISLSPAAATLDACKGQVFTANVTNAADTSVVWTVVEAGGGTVTNGIYTAPKESGTYHVMATSVADPTRTAQGVVTVGPEKVLSVTATPASTSVQPGGGIALAATVTTTCGTYPAQ
jgi:hypothetical protein